MWTSSATSSAASCLSRWSATSSGPRRRSQGASPAFTTCSSNPWRLRSSLNPFERPGDLRLLSGSKPLSCINEIIKQYNVLQNYIIIIHYTTQIQKPYEKDYEQISYRKHDRYAMLQSFKRARCRGLPVGRGFVVALLQTIACQAICRFSTPLEIQRNEELCDSLQRLRSQAKIHFFFNSFSHVLMVFLFFLFLELISVVAWPE